MVTQFDMNLEQMDVKNNFLYGIFEVEILQNNVKINWVCVFIRDWPNWFLQNWFERWEVSLYINSFITLSL